MMRRVPLESEPDESRIEPGPAPAAPAPEDADRAEELARVQRENQELVAQLARERTLRDELEQDARAAKIRAQLAAEDLERAKERIAREARKEMASSRRGVLSGFLDVLDDLDRALVAAEESEHDPALRRGVELVRKRFLDTLARFGVEHMPSLGQPFDPERHDAVSMVPVPDAARDGIIVGVVREGYLMGDDILRPASVAVGRYRI